MLTIKGAKGYEKQSVQSSLETGRTDTTLLTVTRTRSQVSSKSICLGLSDINNARSIQFKRHQNELTLPQARLSILDYKRAFQPI